MVEVKTGTIASQLEFEATVWFGAQVSTTGAVVSSMVITLVNTAEVLPQASLTVQVLV
ncbi:hypothetical protein D3C87_2073040 [compost metagenome]